jgi:cystathionine gamma-synthase
LKLTALRLDTILMKAGAEVDSATGAVTPPLHLSTTFEHTPDGQSLHGHLYIRQSNPTQSRLEEALTASEGGAAALFFASGLAAGAAVLQAIESGSHVLLASDTYHGFREMAQEFLPRWGLTATAVDMTNLEAVRSAMRPETRLLWAETPSNPLLEIVDLSALAEIAHQGGASLLVDSTFATPVLQRPLDLGADIVLHSATKYMGGHSDVQGGALVLRHREALFGKLLHLRTLAGAVASPFNAWLVLRGLRTLVCRVERHASNALALAEALDGHPALETVRYPGLPHHPGHALARRQMRAFGGVVSLAVRGGRDAALTVASRVRLFTNATSLGGVESLIEHRASSEGAASTAPENLLRLSVGLEHPDDLIADLRQALLAIE